MKFLTNAWYVAALADEVGSQPLARTLLDEKIVMFRDEAGLGHALSNVCPHRFALLSKGKLKGSVIECPYHGLQFDVTGVCVRNPHGDTIPERAKLKVYPLHERYGLFWIWMGLPELADPAAIPDFAILERKGWGEAHGHLKIAANYQLIVDNLMDLTHIEYLHPMLSAPDWVEKHETVVSQDGKSMVLSTNRAKDIAIFPINRMLKPDALDVGEQWLDLRWTAPSNVFIDVRFITKNEDILHPIGHFLTPETACLTHYFFRCTRNQSVDDEDLSRRIGESLKQAFSVEDEPMIEDQQQNIGDVDLMSVNPVILRSDNAAIRVRRLLSQLIAHDEKQIQAGPA